MANLVIINPASGDKTASLFASPDSSDEIVTTVEKGTILKVTGTSGNYYMVEYDNGQPNVTKGGTANTGTIVAYPYVSMYSDLRKTEILGNINNGTPITILDDSNSSLIKVSAFTTQGHLEGYVEAKYIYRDNEETPAMYRMTRNNETPTAGVVTPKIGLKTRSGPGTNYNYIGAFNYNAKLTIHESKSGWYRVTGTSGWGDLTDVWVCASYVRVTESTTQVAASKSDTTPITTTPTSTGDDWATYFSTYNSNNLSYTANDEYYRQLAEKYTFALGAPPRYNMDIDIQYLEDIAAAGRVVNKTILSNPAILSICPGKVQMFPNGKLGEERDSIVDTLIGLAGGDTSLKDKITADDPGRFSGKLYRFVADTAEYASYLNALCRSCAIMLGIGDELMPDTSTKLKNFDYAYWTIRKKYSPQANTDTDGSIFRRFWDSLIKTGEKLVTTAVDNTAYINFFLNGSETTVSENISNSTADSPLAGITNTVSSAGAMINYFTGGGYDLSDSEVDAALNAIAGSAGSTLSGIRNLSENFLKGGKMVLPKMVEGAQYGKSVSCNMKFMSPYGNKYSVFLKCIVPICHLLAMALPRQLSDNMYTFPFLIKCAQIGEFTIDLGIISSLTITRGGSDDTSWSIDGIATEWEVQMEITPLVDELMMTSTKHPVLFCKNEVLLDYLSNFCGYDMISFNLGTKSDLAFSFIKNQVIDIPHSLENRISDKMMNLLNPFFTGAWS